MVHILHHSTQHSRILHVGTNFTWQKGLTLTKKYSTENHVGLCRATCYGTKMNVALLKHVGFYVALLNSTEDIVLTPNPKPI